jgi:hypothetical protein
MQLMKVGLLPTKIVGRNDIHLPEGIYSPLEINAFKENCFGQHSSHWRFLALFIVLCLYRCL